MAGYALFALPITHRLPDVEQPSARRRALRAVCDGGWAPRVARLVPDRVEAVSGASQFFLPFAREVLFPSLRGFEAALAARGCDAAGVGFLDTPAAVDDLAGRPSAVLTRVDLGRWQRADAAPAMEVGDARVAFHLDWVDLYLFPDGVGLLAIRVTPDAAAAATVGGLTAFCTAFRRFRPLRVGWSVPTLFDSAGAATSVAAVVDALVASVPGVVVDASRTAMLEFTFFRGQVDGDRGALYPSDRFDPTLLAAYEIASGFPLGGGYEVEPAYLARLLDEGAIALWTDWKGLALRDGVGFAATGAPGPIDANVDAVYFPLWLYALHQALALQSLQARWFGPSTSGSRLAELEVIRLSLARFRARFWSPEVTARPIGLEVYRVFRRALQSDALYAALSTEIDQLHGLWRDRLQDRLNTVVTLVSVIGFPVTFVVAYFGINIDGLTAQGEGFTLAGSIVTTLLLGGLGSLGMWVVLRRLWEE